MNIHTPRPQDDIQAVLGLNEKARQKRRFRRFAWFALALAIIVAAVWWYLAASSNTATISYQTAPAARQDLVISVQATGKVQPTTQVDVSSERSGVIRTVNVKANSRVEKGDVLAELDTERMRAELSRIMASQASAEAKLADARATLAEKQLSLARAERLSKQGISAIQDTEAARAAQARAEAGVKAAEADIEVVKAERLMQETDITKMRILSPVDGIVLKRSAEPGQTVASSLQAPVLFTLAEDLAQMQLEADVDEADIGNVKPGQEAMFSVDAYPGQSFPALIETVEFSPNVTDNVVTYKAVLTVDNSKLLLRPGMTATAQIVTQKIDEALTVPNGALRYTPPKIEKSNGFNLTNLFIPRMPRFEKPAVPAANGERTVYVLENGTPSEVKIRTGVTDGKVTEVLSGELKPGDEVIVSSRQASK
jgi:HlyD family secretion protein